MSTVLTFPSASVPLEPGPEDFRAKAKEIEAFLTFVKHVMTNTADELAYNSPAIDRQALCDALLSLNDIASEWNGWLERAAERVEEERYDGCPRGVMHRSRQ